MLKNTIQRKTRSIKQQKKIKDHTENDLAGGDKLIINIGGKIIVLDKAQQREIREYIYAIGSREEVYTDPEISAKLTEAEKLRNAMLVKIKQAIYNMPVDDLVKYAKRMFDGGDELNMTVN